jgi:hypothetical protein
MVPTLAVSDQKWSGGGENLLALFLEEGKGDTDKAGAHLQPPSSPRNWKGMSRTVVLPSFSFSGQFKNVFSILIEFP